MSADLDIPMPLYCGKCGTFPFSEGKISKDAQGKEWIVAHEKCGSNLIYPGSVDE